MCLALVVLHFASSVSPPPQVSTIEFSLVEVSVLHGLQQGNEVLKEIHKELNVENVERILEETQEAREYQRVRVSIVKYSLPRSSASPRKSTRCSPTRSLWKTRRPSRRNCGSYNCRRYALFLNLSLVYSMFVWQLRVEEQERPIELPSPPTKRPTVEGESPGTIVDLPLTVIFSAVEPEPEPQERERVPVAA